LKLTEIHHALGLHMHQPPGNLRLLIETNRFEAEQIMRCYERAPRYARAYADVARLHVGFSGILLEQLCDPGIQAAYRDLVDIPAMLRSYAETSNVELIGMGYYHPIFPLIPQEDWAEQLEMGVALYERLFGRRPKGFWPPEMAFSMEMVPALARAGYEYVLIDSMHVQPEGDGRDIYRPYLGSYNGATITIIPRDRDLSNAQESGLNPEWFFNEVRAKAAQGEGPRLVTTWSDGENGGWFRQMDEGAGFFGYYFAPYMDRVRSGDSPVRPVLISDYLKGHPATEAATARTGAWNVASTSGLDFSQWAGSPTQKRAIEEVFKVTGRFQALSRKAGRKAPREAREALAQARRLNLEAETSCFLFWGDAWIPQLYERTGPALRLLDEAEARLK
jgi:peptidoglycan/xylan/chitin deacetylase (PgdA/CDA1 family)